MQVSRRTIEASSLAFSSMATTVKPVQKQRAEAMYHKPLGAQKREGGDNPHAPSSQNAGNNNNNKNGRFYGEGRRRRRRSGDL